MDALHLAQIDGKKALLRSKINGLPSADTPYPTTPESNDHWAFIGIFEKSGSETEMKNYGDLVWPGVFMRYEPDQSVYIALRTGNPVVDAWPEPDSKEGADYWKLAGTDSAIDPHLPKPWSARSVRIGSVYHQPVNVMGNYYWGSRFVGFPALLGAEFPHPAQTSSSWTYLGRHLGSSLDPKTFGEPYSGNNLYNFYRARIQDKWVVATPLQYQGAPSPETPFPTELESNAFWRLTVISVHAGTWQNPKTQEDTYTWAGQIHSHPQGNGQALFRSLESHYADVAGWHYDVAEQWQPLGTSLHAGTVADPKGQDELTWPGAVHAATIDEQVTYFRSQQEGVPAEHDWPLPTTASSNEHWQLIADVPALGTFEEPRRFDDYSQAGSVYLDTFANGQHNYYISRIEGYPADDIDSFATIGRQGDPNWEFVGRHSGLMTDLKPFDDITRVGAFHEAPIAGQRALVRSLIAGWPSSATPYPVSLASTEHWEFIGVFKHDGTSGDFKGKDEVTWPGALHLDEAQQFVFAAKQAGEPGPEGWSYPVGEESNDQWDFVMSLATNSGTVEAPRERNMPSVPGAIFADQRGLLHQKLYRAKFSGYAKDLGAAYPSKGESNEFYDYLGDHAGTFTDPKPFTEPTWTGAVHQTTIDGQLAFLKAKFDGAPSVEKTPYPERLASNEYWDFEFTTEQAGTYVDPKSMSGHTWPGAIHHYTYLGNNRLYAAQRVGDPEAEGWPSPIDPSGEYWKFVGNVRHKGTFADPKQLDEVTGIGLIHTTTIDGSTVYFRSLVNGDPTENGWAYPETATSNEYWVYLGSNLRQGTWDDPKGANDFTWPGQMHAVQIGDKRVYLQAKMDGLPAEHDWPYPDGEDNTYWSIAGESRHSGSFSDPKDQQEVTWVGAVHMRQDGERRMYYRSKVVGNLVAIGNSYPLPVGQSNNVGWEYVGANSAAGTLEDPHIGSVLTWPGNVHKLTRDSVDAYYLAQFTGNADNSHPFPAAVGASNDDWAFVGKNSLPGTVLEPKDAYEITWPDAIHRFERGGKSYFVKSKTKGVPPASGWVFPIPPNSDDRWELVDIGVHAGTWSDPKFGNDPTWPGALHRFEGYKIGDLQYKAFKRSKFWGRYLDHAGSANQDLYFDFVGYSLYLGTLDSPKFFDQPTWVGAIHLDRSKDLLFEAKKSGEMGIDVGEHPTGPEDNDSWHFLGFHRNAGTYQNPKEFTEYTWPGRIHNYDIGRTILYFSSKMTGTPSAQNPPWVYPADESSNDWWAYEGRTDHAGTFADPHELNEVTWRGAIHQVRLPDRIRYFEARFAGNGQQLGYDYPKGEVSDLHWKYVATGIHAGTVEDPKDYDEPVWPGTIVVSTRSLVGRYYYVAQNDGVPHPNNWPLPSGGASNENWVYFGVSSHAGTKEDPKAFEEVTWPGAYNFSNYLGIRAFFSPTKAGVPANNNWIYPTNQTSDENWIYSGFVHDKSTIDKPKSWNDITDVGLIHVGTVAYQRMLFAAKFSGQAKPPELPSSDPGKVFPSIDADNEWWKFIRKGSGTVDIPNDWNDYSQIGDINESLNEGKRLLYRAQREGKPSVHGWYYPASEIDNPQWKYLSTHRGTNDDPKEWPEFTEPGDFHRYPHGNQTLFFKALKEGYPANLGWYPTQPDESTDVWTYAGLHAGTRQDPKTWEEPTWPGAIHWYREKDLYFTSKVTGNPSQHGWYYPSTASSNAQWQLIDTGRWSAPGINDFSKPFDEYTWVTAHNAYIGDRGMVQTLRDHLNRGIRGFMIDIHMDVSENPQARQVRVCHLPNVGGCWLDAPLLRDALPVFIDFLKAHKEAVISILFESTAPAGEMKKVLDQFPELANYSFSHGERKDGVWPTLQEMINTNQRLVMFADNQVAGGYNVGGKIVNIYGAKANQVENTYNLGRTALIHDWECRTRYDALTLSLRKADGNYNRPFVLNQFHEWGSSTAHAGDQDNNLTWLQRRVERYCGQPTGWRKPNYLAIDFNQVGDAFPYAAALSQGGFYFYEGNNADRDRDTVCVLPASQSSPGGFISYDLRLKSHGCENDEIRSMELDGISAGTRIEFYDSHDADRQDDFTIIDVKQSVPLGQRVRINSLEGSEDNFWYRKLAMRNNGLDGKISRIKISTTPRPEDFADAQVVFYEETNARQNIVCTVPFIRVNVKAKKNGYGCDNDEIDSAVIVQAKAGSYFSVVGHPDGDYSQGLAEVRVKKDIQMPVVIGNFESNFENDFVKVRRCRGHKLEGKISFLYFWPEGHALDCGE